MAVQWFFGSGLTRAEKGAGLHLEPNLVILRGHDFNSSATPPLLLWGRHDPLLPPSIGDRMARAIPGARLVFLEESGHLPMVEEPERFNQVVLDFLSR